MSEVDFSKAPAGATHIGTSNGFFTPWYKLDNGIWSYVNQHADEYNALASQDWQECSQNTPYHRPVREIPRPKVEEKPAGVPAVEPWVEGVTLPPVGTKVELNRDLLESTMFKSSLKKGDVVEIIAHMRVYDTDSEDESVAVFRHNIGFSGAHSVRQGVAQCFKRIKTAEEIAAEKKKEELHALLKELGQTACASYSDSVLLSELYDAGKLNI